MAKSDDRSIILEDGVSQPCKWCGDILPGSLDAQIAHCARHGITERAELPESDRKDSKVWLTHPSANT